MVPGPVSATVCTLVLAWQVFSDTPVAVAANRDEALDRPSEPPERRDWDPAVVAPKDAEADGTWIGYNEHGVFAGITNRWLVDPPAAERSRGLLVRDALACRSAEDAAREVERAVERHSYDGFNLVLADENAAIYVEWDGRLSVDQFQPGVHVVVNVGADGRYAIPAHRPEVGELQGTNADAVRTALQPEPGEAASSWLDRAAAVISDHEYGVCVHGLPDEVDATEAPANANFGTRSSSLVTIGPEGGTYRFADGPPCSNPYRVIEGHL